MLDRMTYTNHQGQTIEFGATEGEWKGLLIGKSDVRDYAWTYDTANDRITNFRKGVVTKSLPYIVVSDRADEIKNNMSAIADVDIRANKKGTLEINGNKLRCYIYSVSTPEYLTNRRYRAGTIGIATDDPTWRIYLAKQDFLIRELEGDSGIDYPYDYPYDYLANNTTKKLLNKAIIDCDFILTIAGPVTNPSINIDGHTYTFNISLLKHEYLIINSMDKTVVKHSVPSESIYQGAFESAAVPEEERVKYYVNGSIEFREIDSKYINSSIAGYNEYDSQGVKIAWTKNLFNDTSYALNPNTEYISLYCYESIYDASKTGVTIVYDLDQRGLPETITNEFNCRNKRESVFEKIPPNIYGNDVSWDETFSFDIVLVYEQSEPKWGGNT